MIVFFSDISWDNLWQRPHHFASRFAENDRVVWIEPIVLGEKPMFKPKAVRHNLFRLSLPVIPYNARNKWIRRLAYALSQLSILRWFVRFAQGRMLRRGLRYLEADQEETIFVVENIHFAHLASTQQPAFFLFDYIDNALGFVNLPNHCHEELRAAAATADAVSVTSGKLEAQLREFRDGAIHLVSNGVEFQRFVSPSVRERPHDLPEGLPVVEYIGSIYSWVDFDLIELLCTRFPDVRFVFIGRAHPEIVQRLKQLELKSNFLFLGFRKYDLLPQYLSHCDAAIIPFQRNNLTESVNPVKLYEYCAAGVPTITTLFSDELMELNDLIFIARTHDEFCEQLKKVLHAPFDPHHRERLIDFARRNDWDAKFAALSSLIRRRAE